ncbi:MAG: hypothetical protein WA061_02425 [Microgenomates group bacterium]
MNATTYEANKILNHIFGGAEGGGASVYTPEAVWHVGLSTTLIDATGVYTEPAGGGYDRVDITNDKTTWSDSTVATLQNDIAVTFPASSSSWGTIVSVFLIDSGTPGAGNTRYYYNLNPSFPVVGGSTVSFSAGNIDMSMP